MAEQLRSNLQNQPFIEPVDSEMSEMDNDTDRDERMSLSPHSHGEPASVDGIREIINRYMDDPANGGVLNCSGLPLNKVPDFRAVPGVTSQFLEGVTQLDLSGTGISGSGTLAQIFEQFPHLTYLKLSDNEIDDLIGIHLFQRLRFLDVRYNIDIDTLLDQRIEHCSNLQRLYLDGSSVEECDNPALNHVVDFANISDLDESSDHGQPSDDEGAELSLEQEVRHWIPLPPQAIDAINSQRAWQGFNDEPDAASFAKLLSRLKETAEYKNSKTRDDFVQNVAELLGAIASDEKLRGECFSLARDGLGECGDRVHATLLNMFVAKHVNDSRGTTPELLDLATKFYMRDAIVRFGHQYANGHEGAANGEGVEVVLYLLKNLGGKYQLPAVPKRMRYEDFVETTMDNKFMLAEADEFLQKQMMDDAALTSFIANQRFWQRHLGGKYGNHFKKIESEFEQRLVKAEERQLQSISPGDKFTISIESKDWERRYGKPLQKTFDQQHREGAINLERDAQLQEFCIGLTRKELKMHHA